MPERQKVNQEIERLVEEYWNPDESSYTQAVINRGILIRELKGHSDATVEAAMREEALHWMERARDAAVWRPFSEEARREIFRHLERDGELLPSDEEFSNAELLWQQLEDAELLWQQLEKVIIRTASAGFRRGYASAREDMRKAGYVFPKRSRLDRTETAPDICTYEGSDKTKERDCE